VICHTLHDCVHPQYLSQNSRTKPYISHRPTAPQCLTAPSPLAPSPRSHPHKSAGTAACTAPAVAPSRMPSPQTPMASTDPPGPYSCSIRRVAASTSPRSLMPYLKALHSLVADFLRFERCVRSDFLQSSTTRANLPTFVSLYARHANDIFSNLTLCIVGFRIPSLDCAARRHFSSSSAFSRPPPLPEHSR